MIGLVYSVGAGKQARLTLHLAHALHLESMADATPLLDLASRWADATDWEVCEGCHGPAESHDEDGVPLCEVCYDALVEDGP